MNSTLKEVISEKCRKKVISLESYSENEGEVEEMEEKESEIVEELPFEDILADKRRKYSAKEEFIFLLYNDTLQYFVKEWDGTYLRKKPTKILVDDSRNSSNDDEDIGERQDYEDVNESKESDNNSEEFNNDTNKSSFVSSWKLSLPDEFANIRFISNNTYSGRISRKMMEGEGVYKWSNGARYKGEFEQNVMHGKGLLEWNNVCWYEGDFTNGYRHGRGIMVDGENRYMYTGQWHMGQRHGKGYSRYSDNGSYDGDWVMNKMNGIGLRIYPSGGRYVGQWKNGVRDGIGTMVWPNGSLYRGEWKCGAMHGYGEYVWNGFFNKTFAWPQEASYVGYWRRGMRHGKGEIKLNSVGGAKYSGYWKDNKKHGYGVIIGSNGHKFEANPLFSNDILCAPNVVADNLETETKTKDEGECMRTAKEIKTAFVEKPGQLVETWPTPILKPEQFLCLSYYITRLLDPKNMEPSVVFSPPSGKCYSCERESCSCLPHPLSIDTITSERNDITQTHAPESYTENMIESVWKYEECWTYNCLTFHMHRLREIYNDYATLFAKSAPKCNLAMSRLCLWQLWRDCGIHKKGLSLTEIDSYIGER
nr:uncharacterized protein LOC117158062 [Bombus vancouverensis nearcticus]